MKLIRITTPTIALALMTGFTMAGFVGSGHVAAADEFIVSRQVVSDQAVGPHTYASTSANNNYEMTGTSIVQGGTYDSGSYESESSPSGAYESGSYESGAYESGSCASGDCGGAVETANGGGMNRRTFGQPDLFYNYYTQGYANRANAQLYISPNPVPPHVGHTYYTYQPFYPHEYLYGHKNRFHNYYDNGRGMNRTRAVYSTKPIHSAISNIYWNKLRLPR